MKIPHFFKWRTTRKASQRPTQTVAPPGYQNCPHFLIFESSAEVRDETEQRSSRRQIHYTDEDESCFLSLRKRILKLFLPSSIWGPCYRNASWSAISIHMQTWEAAAYEPVFFCLFWSHFRFWVHKELYRLLALSGSWPITN